MTQPPDKHYQPLTIDWDAYGAMLEESDLSDEQKREFIHVLWSIVVSFVDLGFGVHPIQQIKGDEISFDELEADDVVDLPKAIPPAKHEPTNQPV